MTYRSLEKEAEQTLADHKIYTGFARLLMLEMLRALDQDMYALAHEKVDLEFADAYHKNVAALCKDIPLGYVLGYEWFYGYKINVNEAVLIPRSETEELVGNVLMDIDEFYESPVIADVASGSGAIAIALAKELDVHVYATDISQDALAVAQDNAHANQADVTFMQGDMLEPLIKENIMLDVLVCNPPYIKNTEHIQTSVLNYEPHVALFGGHDGLKFYRSVLEKAQSILKPKGMIAFEIGFDIGEAVVACAKHHFPQARVVLKQDINQLDRMVFIYT